MEKPKGQGSKQAHICLCKHSFPLLVSSTSQGVNEAAGLWQGQETSSRHPNGISATPEEVGTAFTPFQNHLEWLKGKEE